MSVVVVGLNHRTAPVRLLERASVPATELGGVLAELISGTHVAEAVVLSTCNRVEVYAAVNTFHGALHEIGQVLAARTGGVGNSCGQAACVPPRPARGQKRAKALQALAFSAPSACFSPLLAPARQRRGICRLSRCFRRSTAMVRKSNMQVLPFKNSFIGIHLCQPDFMIFVGKTHKIQAAFSSFPAYRLL